MNFTALPQPAVGSNDKPRERESGKPLGRRVLLQNLQQRVAIGENVACVTAGALGQPWEEEQNFF